MECECIDEEFLAIVDELIFADEPKRERVDDCLEIDLVVISVETEASKLWSDVF